MALFSNFLKQAKEKSGWNTWEQWHPHTQRIVKLFPLLLILFAIPLTVGFLQQQQNILQFAVGNNNNPCALSNTSLQPSPSTFYITSGPNASNISNTDATITWNLCDYGTGKVEYGTSTSYGLLSRPENTFNYNFHLQSLSNLSPGTTYHYRITSSNKAGATVISTDNTFTTTTNSVSTPTPTVTVNSSSPTPTSTSPSGASVIPSMPTGGNLLRKDFSDNSLSPFRILTYPNSHPGDYMIYAGKYVTDVNHISVHDGYLDLRATRNSDNTWSQAFVGTGMDGNGGAATFSFQYGYLQYAARMNVGYASWQDPLWMLANVTAWNGAEIDSAEAINNKLTFNLHGVGNVSVGSATPPSDLATNFHIFGVAKTSDHITFTMDGKVIARWNGSMPDKVALLSDAKVGYGWMGTSPNASTPNPSFVNLAWITIDSTIPAGL